MAKVFQLISTEKKHKHFEPALVNGDFHAALEYGGLRTICGVQLDGEDGIASGEGREGVVTCPGCFAVIGEIKKIRKWRYR